MRFSSTSRRGNKRKKTTSRLDLVPVKAFMSGSDKDNLGVFWGVQADLISAELYRPTESTLEERVNVAGPGRFHC